MTNKLATSILAIGLLSACSDSRSEVHNYKALESFVSYHRVGSDRDYWIEMMNLSGQWERVGLIFGYLGDRDECLKAISGLKDQNEAREYRCVPANAGD